MTEIISASKSFPKVNLNHKNWISYFSLLILGNAAMWGLGLFYINSTSPTYKSEFSLSLPGNISHTNVNLPERGTAYSQPVSPYENSIQDPRENYKLIMESSIVQEAAAAKLKMTPEEFGEPQIKILDKTTAINLEFKGDTPKEAQAKSWVFFKALQDRLNTLRYKESTQKESKVDQSLQNSQKKLELAQKRFFEYRNLSGLVTDTQLEDLANNLELLRNKRNEAAVKKQQTSTRVKELSSNFNISTQEANKTFILQSDQIFRQHLQNYTDATSNLVILESKFLPNHPSMIDAKQKVNLASSALLARSNYLLGYPIDQKTLNKLSSDGVQKDFVQGIVTARLDNKESNATIQELDDQITQLQTRLQAMAKHKSTLEALKREMQIAEAVYSSNLASLDANKSNFYGSYPRIQLLTEPNLPEEPSSPKKKLIFAGIGLASVFSATAVLTLYLRSNSIKVAKKKIS